MSFVPSAKGLPANRPTLLLGAQRQSSRADAKTPVANKPVAVHVQLAPRGSRTSAWSPATARSSPVLRTRGTLLTKPAQSREAKEVAAFLQSLALEQYSERILRNGFDDMDTLMHIEDGDLRDLGLAPCHVVKLRRKLQELLRRAAGGAAGAGEHPVAAFLQGAGLGCYSSALLSNGFDELDLLLDLEDGDMRDMGIPRGHAVKLRRRLHEYFSEEGSAALAKREVAAQPGACADAMRTAVERSWQEVQAFGTGRVAELLYKHTFELEPQLVHLFSPEVVRKYRDWTAEEGNHEGSFESPALRKLFSKYVNAVGCTVAGLNDFAQLVPMLKALGARHISYGVKEWHWPILGKAFVLALREALGTSFTHEVEAAWTMVYAFMSNIMIEGLRQAIRASEQGDMSDSRSASEQGGALPVSEKTLSSRGVEPVGSQEDTESPQSQTGVLFASRLTSTSASSNQGASDVW